jgi:hypothetical protein
MINKKQLEQIVQEINRLSGPKWFGYKKGSMTEAPITMLCLPLPHIFTVTIPHKSSPWKFRVTIGETDIFNTEETIKKVEWEVKQDNVEKGFTVYFEDKSQLTIIVLKE